MLEEMNSVEQKRDGDKCNKKRKNRKLRSGDAQQERRT